MAEFLYILENASFPGIVKIGKTERAVPERVRELSCATGVPTEFTIFKQYTVEDSTATERKVHERLSDCRVSESREFFRISADEAASIIEEMLCSDFRKISDYEREDDLFFAATEIAVWAGKVEWPGVLAGPLKISYEEAIRLIEGLKVRGILNDRNELCGDLLGEHIRRVRNLQRKRQRQERVELERKRIHYQMIREVKDLLAGLTDPETGEEAEVSFENDNGNLVVAIRGSEWVKTEAQRRLSAMREQ